MDDAEEAIDVSGSPFAPASDYLGKRLVRCETIYIVLLPSPSPAPPPPPRLSMRFLNSLRPQKQ